LSCALACSQHHEAQPTWPAWTTSNSLLELRHIACKVTHLGDRDFAAQQLLDTAYLDRRRSLIDPRHASQSGDDDVRAARRAQALASTNTTHFVTADGQGNFVSWTQTLGRHFGSRTMAGDTGIILNNFAQAYPRHGLPMAASIVTDAGGRPWMAVGAVGPLLQSIPQMISHVIDFQLNPQAALEAPRICVFEDFRVMLEGRFADATVRELTSRGHQCEVVGEWAFGEGEVSRGQMIVRDATGTLMAASDTRADGAAQAV